MLVVQAPVSLRIQYVHLSLVCHSLKGLNGHFMDLLPYRMGLQLMSYSTQCPCKNWPYKHMIWTYTSVTLFLTSSPMLSRSSLSRTPRHSVYSRIQKSGFHRFPSRFSRVSSSQSAMARDDPAYLDGGVHPGAASGFNADQSIYESARPSYPPAVLELVKREIVPSLGAPATTSTLSVLDLAAGTGKWTQLLLPFGIDQLVAVEPSPGMRGEFQRLYPGVVVLDGTATAIPLPDASVDVVFIAQAFHWFANVSALTEIHRVLKKGGTVVLIWNLEDRKTAWVARLRDAYEKHEAGTPQYRLGLWRRPFEEPEMAESVSKMFQLPIQERHVDHSVSNSKNAVWQRVLSKSYIAVLATEQKAELKKQVDHILSGSDIHWDTQGDEQVLQYPYTTDIAWFKKLS